MGFSNPVFESPKINDWKDCSIIALMNTFEFMDMFRERTRKIKYYLTGYDAEENVGWYNSTKIEGNVNIHIIYIHNTYKSKKYT